VAADVKPALVAALRLQMSAVTKTAVLAHTTARIRPPLCFGLNPANNKPKLNSHGPKGAGRGSCSGRIPKYSAFRFIFHFAFFSPIV